MTWKSYVPGSGKMTVRKKLAELEEQAGSLVVVFGVTFGKVIEYVVLWRLGLAARFAAASAVIASVYLYRHEAKKAAEAAAEKAAEKAEETAQND
jgi:hypothetical protein